MRILFVTENLSRGGKERRLIELLKGIKACEDIECRLVLLSKDIEYKEIFDLDIRLYLLERRTRKDIRVYFSIFKICREFRPDIIHSWGSMPSIYCMPTVLIMRPLFINAMISNAICHRFSKNHIRSLLTFPFSDAIVANSNAGLRNYHVPQKKGIVIHNGFDPVRVRNLISPKSVRSLLHLGNNFIVGMVGAFHERKDYKTFISAAKIILQNRNDVVFLAIGDGNLLEQMKSETQGYDDRIKFPGLIKDIESYINAFDIGVLLTNPEVHQEGISNSILEYMALSKPVIATMGGGTGELILENLNGFMIEPFQVYSLVKRINVLLNDEGLRISMGENGCKRVQEMFTIEKMINKTIGLYEALLKR